MAGGSGGGVAVLGGCAEERVVRFLMVDSGGGDDEYEDEDEDEDEDALDVVVLDLEREVDRLVGDADDVEAAVDAGCSVLPLRGRRVGMV